MGLIFSLAGVPYLVADTQAAGSGPAPEPQVGSAQLGLLLLPGGLAAGLEGAWMPQGREL